MSRKKTVTRRPTYSDAIRWIAMNDEPGEMDQDVVSGFISTILVADLFGADEHKVANDVIRCRAYRDNPSNGVPAMYRV